MSTKVKNKIEITGYTPDFDKSILKVLALSGRHEKENLIPFSEIAKEFTPKNDGKSVVVYIDKYGEHGFSHSIELPLSPAGFISEILLNVGDTKMSLNDRAPFVLEFDNVLTTILERRAV